MEKWCLLTSCVSLPDKVRTETLARNSSAMLLYVVYVTPRRPIVEEKNGSSALGLFRRSTKHRTRAACQCRNVVEGLLCFVARIKGNRLPVRKRSFCWKIHYF